MARIFITGSSDGLGSLAANALVKKGHKVVLHARNEQRAKDAADGCPGSEAVLVGDLSSFGDTKRLAAEANKLGEFDVVVHNAGLYRGAFNKSVDGVPSLTAVNTFAPYILTALMHQPKRLVYVSSGMHFSANSNPIDDIDWSKRGQKRWSDTEAYCESKVHIILLAKAVARYWPDVKSNSLDPGWVATKMGGATAPDDIQASIKTYLTLIEGEVGSGKYFKNSAEKTPKDDTFGDSTQDQFLKKCEEITGVSLPKK